MLKHLTKVSLRIFFFLPFVTSGNAFATVKLQKLKISDELLSGVENFSSFVRIESGSYKWEARLMSMVEKMTNNLMVKISKPFWISKFELTNREWNLVFEEEFQKENRFFS